MGPLVRTCPTARWTDHDPGPDLAPIALERWDPGPDQGLHRLDGLYPPVLTGGVPVPGSSTGTFAPWARRSATASESKSCLRKVSRVSGSTLDSSSMLTTAWALRTHSL